jgi:putative flavoprotein involved in K+ transport
MSTNGSGAHFDVVVVGGGQAGLAMGYFLARQGRSFVILDAADSIGATWRSRWDSLVLFTTRRYDGLPGLVFPGDPHGYPTRDEVAAYLARYAANLELPVQLETRVRSLTMNDGRFVLGLENGTIEADQVVVATGPFQAPFTPELASSVGPEVVQMHSTVYRKPNDIPDGTVLVVGGGNTGFQIAKELSATHPVHLAIGSRQTPLPQNLLGRDLFWWLTKLGLIDKTADSRLGQRLRDRDTLIGSSPRAVKRSGVQVRPRAVAVSGRKFTFADKSELDVDAVIWATGYRLDHSWIDVAEAIDGHIPHKRGVTDVPGLYFLGLQWQHTRGSALLGWVKDDAEYIAENIAAFARSRTGVVASSVIGLTRDSVIAPTT